METKEKRIAFVLFDAYHQKKDSASSRIRGHWLMKYWPEAEPFVQGKDYDVVIYQKTYWREHARAFKGKKILDICDPDWLEGIPVAEFMDLMDAITVPTEALKEAIEKFCDKPVYVVKDRIDWETIPPRKEHTDETAKEVVWFGYAHNASVLEPALNLLHNLGLTLRVISNGTYATGECKVENDKWEPETSNQNIQKSDFALLPRPNSGKHQYKSENKEIQANALGLPVAKTAEDVRRLMDPAQRKKEADERYQYAKENYDVKQSVEEMKKIVANLFTKGQTSMTFPTPKLEAGYKAAQAEAEYAELRKKAETKTL